MLDSGVEPSALVYGPDEFAWLLGMNVWSVAKPVPSVLMANTVPFFWEAKLPPADAVP